MEGTGLGLFHEKVGLLVLIAALFVGAIRVGALNDWAMTVAETSAPDVSTPAEKTGETLLNNRIVTIKNDTLVMNLLTSSVYIIYILIGTKKGG